MATTLAEKLASSEKLSIAGTDAFPLLATPSGTPSPGMTRFNTLGAAFAKGTIPFAAGNLATSQPFAVTQTWTNAAVTYSGMQVAITDTASAVGSLLFEAKVGGLSRFSIRKDGRVNLPTAFLQDQSGGQLSISDLAYISTGGLQLIGSSGALSFGAVLGVPDTFLLRDGANTLAIRNGVNPQILRLANTYTDASNYERAEIAWVANVLQIGAVGLGTGTQRTTMIKGATIQLAFGATPTVAWNITAAGHFHAQTDNLYDIGATTTTLRPRNLFMAGTGYFGSTLQTVGVFGVGIAPNNAAWIALAASTTARSSLNLPATGVAPSAPANGDIWFDGAALEIQIGGATKTFTVT